MGIPIVIHEQNAFPGVTTKMLAKRASRVLLAIPDAEKYLETKTPCTVTGNPIRAEIVTAKKGESRRKLGLDARPSSSPTAAAWERAAFKRRWPI